MPRSAFDEAGTIGVEEEYYVVDADSYEPVAASSALLEDPPDDLEGHLDVELFEFVLETTTEKASSVDEARRLVERKRSALVEYAGEYGWTVQAAGLPPSVRWTEYTDLHVDKPRYTEQLNRIAYPQHRNLTAGLHVHVGVDDADVAARVADDLRFYVPLLLAASANSPYWYRRDTGLESARSVVFENLPNTGLPTEWGSYEEFERVEQRMVESDSVRDRGELWWDVRPHTEYGTVEVRTPDAQVDVERTHAFVALIHGLVEALVESPLEQDLRREFLVENKWRAARWGRDAEFLTPDGGERAFEVVFDEALEFVDVASGDVAALDGGSAAEVQRDAYEAGGFDAVDEAIELD